MDGAMSFSFFLIFSGAAVLATVALYTRQPLLLAYIVLGGLVGPYGLAWVNDTQLISDIAKIGIVFLLFLLGLDMQPRALLHVLRKATVVTLLSALVFGWVAYVIMRGFGYTPTEALIAGMSATVSSTILGIKLLPTTALHHKHTGELLVGLLLAQDFIAILALLALAGDGADFDPWRMSLTFLSLPLLAAIAYVLVRWIFLPLIARFDRFQEYIFLLAIGWCLGVAELAHAIGLSSEIGAFVAGIMIATSPISQYIATALKPLRDFFLILFFFSVGASFNSSLLGNILVPVGVLTAVMLVLKPVVFYGLLKMQREHGRVAWEIGFRLGHISEFSLLITYLAVSKHLIGEEASMIIQATAILLFMLSTYLVILNYPSPIAISEKLRRD
jgi:Kef-type K+ transport system membrane component KefB